MMTPRQHEIIGLAKVQGRVTVDELALRFGVTPQTIRKDLNDLCEQRLMSRIHGGAVVSSGVENLSYEARRLIAQDEKRAIGRAAADIIPDGASLFINIGTTTEEVARSLLDRSGLLVITNNLNVAMLLYPHPRIDVIMAGGPVRRADGAVIGSAAVDFIRLAHITDIDVFVTDRLPDGPVAELCHAKGIRVVECGTPELVPELQD